MLQLKDDTLFQAEERVPEQEDNEDDDDDFTVRYDIPARFYIPPLLDYEAFRIPPLRFLPQTALLDGTAHGKELKNLSQCGAPEKASAMAGGAVEVPAGSPAAQLARDTDSCDSTTSRLSSSDNSRLIIAKNLSDQFDALLKTVKMPFIPVGDGNLWFIQEGEVGVFPLSWCDEFFLPLCAPNNGHNDIQGGNINKKKDSDRKRSKSDKKKKSDRKKNPPQQFEPVKMDFRSETMIESLRELFEKSVLLKTQEEASQKAYMESQHSLSPIAEDVVSMEGGGGLGLNTLNYRSVYGIKEGIGGNKKMGGNKKLSYATSTRATVLGQQQHAHLATPGGVTTVTESEKETPDIPETVVPETMAMTVPTKPAGKKKAAAAKTGMKKMTKKEKEKEAKKEKDAKREKVMKGKEPSKTGKREKIIKSHSMHTETLLPRTCSNVSAISAATSSAASANSALSGGNSPSLRESPEMSSEHNSRESEDSGQNPDSESSRNKDSEIPSNFSHISRDSGVFPMCSPPLCSPSPVLSTGAGWDYADNNWNHARHQSAFRLPQIDPTLLKEHISTYISSCRTIGPIMFLRADTLTPQLHPEVQFMISKCPAARCEIDKAIRRSRVSEFAHFRALHQDLLLQVQGACLGEGKTLGELENEPGVGSEMATPESKSGNSREGSINSKEGSILTSGFFHLC